MTRQTRCRDCHKRYAATHYVENKSAYLHRSKINNPITQARLRERVARYLEEHPCVDCGESDIVVLDFDHVRGEKSHNVAQLVLDSASWDRVSVEIDKCDVRCANCHRRRTAAAGNFWRYRRRTPACVGRGLVSKTDPASSSLDAGAIFPT